MYVLIRIDGTTEPQFNVKLLGLYETVDDARDSMRKDVASVVWRITQRDAVGDECELKEHFLGTHVFLHECFWQWVIFDADKPHEWSSLFSW